MYKIHGLYRLKKDDKKNDNNNNNNMEEFSQHGAQSGTSVYRPVKGNDSGNPMKDIANLARRQNDASSARDRSVGLITLYANGFKLGEGEFRDIKVGENAQFIKALKNGVVPNELEDEVKKEFGDVETIGVQLVDKSNEVYKPDADKKDKPKYEFDKSKGNSLASSTSSAPSSAPLSSPSSSGGFASAKPITFVIDEAQPTTELQLVLHNRTRIKQKFNHSTTVLQVYQHVMAVSKINKFDLLAGFPPKPLTDPNATLKDAGLFGASLQQRK